ncbi:MAG: APC family permease [Armatimonadia bacterium]
MPYSLRRLLMGTPLPTSRMSHERIGPAVGLSVFSADALSSVAYGTEEVLLALVAAGTAGLSLSIYPAIAISVLIAIVAFSYRQTIMHYPDGGGAYIVAKDNLGVYPGLVAGAALLIDYVLTVAVSVTSGVAAVVSAFPLLAEYRVVISITMIGLVALINLRGTRESGCVFAGPTYLFIISMLGLIVAGLLTHFTGEVHPITHVEWLPAVAKAVTPFLLLRAFASGCAALTGIEAVANGVRAFRDPSAANAIKVMGALAVLLFTMFLGISWLAHVYQVTPDPTAHETVVSQIAEAVFGRGFFYYIIQGATAMILFLAVNTSFADFPRLSSLLARDGYLPRQMANLGDRLVFSNGIIILALAASFLVLLFGGLTHALIPLYAVGVFLAFTLSQTGMVIRWWRKRESGWHAGLIINSLGAVTTAVVLAVILMVKFAAGAWMVVVLIPLLVLEFRAIHKHYLGVAARLRLDVVEKLPVHATTVLIPVAGLHKGVIRALRFAAGLKTPSRAIHVATDPEAAAKLKQQWQKLDIDIPLDIVESPYRSLTAPLLDYVDSMLQRDPNSFVAVIIPEFVPQHWRHAFLHNQSALMLSFALRSRPNAVLISVRHSLSEPPPGPPSGKYEVQVVGAPTLAFTPSTDVEVEPPAPSDVQTIEPPAKPEAKPAAPPAAPPGTPPG